MTTQRAVLVDTIAHALDNVRFWLRSFVATDDVAALHQARQEIEAANRAADDLVKTRQP